MNIVADESVDAPIVHHLREEGYSVEYITELCSGDSDEKVLETAFRKSALLITCDKDFGELIFRLSKNHCGVLLLRIDGISNNAKTFLVKNIIKTREKELKNNSAVLTYNQLRIRQSFRN